MSSLRVERRLAAILAADVVGYSRLLEADEAGTLDTLRRVRKQLFNPLVAEHRGRIVKLMGDGAIVEFASVVDAVACAVAFQNSVATDQAQSSSDRQIAFRIGINLGDVVVEGEDLLGDGVNVASRLEGLAEPGGICVSDAVQRQLDGKADFAFVDSGEQQLKNIARPVRVWRWVSDSAATPPAQELSLPNRPSVAVLPFDNLSGQPEETYFSDGITEDIITGLARFRSLFVIARNSSFAFRGKSVDLTEVGRKLGVSFILEGSVRRSGSRVRITAQLIEAASGAHIWAERYDRSLDDIFAVQDEVAQTIVSTLVKRIEDAKLQQSFRKPTTSLAAYDCLLNGLAYFRSDDDGANERALELFEKAVTLDPHYAVAHAFAAYVPVAMEGHASAPAAVLEVALARARQALDLDPQESRCHRILSTIYLYRRDYDLAERHIQRAFDLNPNDSEVLIFKGRLLSARGRSEEALVCFDAAFRLNPLYQYSTGYNSLIGVPLYSLRRFEEAAMAFRRIPRPVSWSLARLAACYAQLGRTQEAQSAVAEVLRLQPDFSITTYMQRSVLLERREDRQSLIEGLTKAGLPA
jgi:TolB-like protein/Tfp pilus assembly protein PilF